MSITASLSPITLLSSILAFEDNLKNIREIIPLNNDIHIEDISSEIFETEYKTKIVNRDILIKTLEEHDCIIEKERLNYIKCKIDKLSLEFYKTGENELEPYKLKIKCLEECDIETLVEDLSLEYAQNAQEASYNKIIKRLNEKNMKIENEEVFDDDTVVITVNLD